MSVMPAISPCLLPSVLANARNSPAIMGGIPARNQLAALFVERDGQMTDIIGVSTAPVLPGIGLSPSGGETILFSHLQGNETVVEVPGACTSSITVSAGTLTLGAGVLWGWVELSDGTRFSLSEGVGTLIINANDSTKNGLLSTDSIWTLFYDGSGFDLNLLGYHTGCLGPNICGNSTFDVDEWWTKGAGVTIGDGSCHCDGIVGTIIYADVGFKTGETWSVSILLENWTSGDIEAHAGGDYANPSVFFNGERDENGWVHIEITTIDPNGYVILFANNALTADIKKVLIRRKYFGSQYGVNVCGNSTFDVDEWWTKGAGVTIAAGECTLVNATGNLLFADIGIQAGETWEVLLKMTSWTSGDIEAHAGGDTGETAVAYNEFDLGSRWLKLEFTAITPNGYVVIYANNAINAVIDKCYIKRKYASPVIPYASRTADALNNASPISAPINILGDSLSFGYGKYISSENNLFKNNGVGGETSSQILARFLAADDWSSTFVAWMGFNNRNDLTHVREDLNTFISNLKTNRYLILPIHNASTEPAGSQEYTDIMAFNAESATLYGAHYFDLRSYLVSLYNPELPQDIIDFGNDVVPDSLRVDSVHFTAAGYQIIANKVKEVLLVRSYLIYSDFVPGAIKLSLQGSAGAYYWPTDPRLELRTGVNNAVYNADGSAKTFATQALAMAALASVADDEYLFAGTKGAVLYLISMLAKAVQIKRYVGDTD